MAKTGIREAELYAPVKALLEGQGYEVKGEIGAADVVAARPGDETGEDPLIVELKTGFSLSLFHQAVERQKLTDIVYVAVPRGSGAAFNKALKENKALCRRLGLGLITVRLETSLVEVHCDPAPYSPRKSKQRRARLLREFARRVGDPNEGGSTRQGLMTAYRQDALRCLKVLTENGPTKAALVAEQSGVQTARRLMADDHYGWFERVETGIYALTPKGVAARKEYATEIRKLSARPSSGDGGETRMVGA
ncbi:MAG: hypothetical protein KDJ90_04670 [Nitratireductor sp.]|nr:hypothetical protein [Nitratireductor sp.]